MRHYYCVTTPPAPGTDPSAEPQATRPAHPPYPAPGQAAPPYPGPAAPGHLPHPAPPYPAQAYQVPPGYYAPPGYPYVPPAVSPAGYPLADFGQRLAARFIDGLILGAMAAVVVIPAYIYFAFVVIEPLVTVNGELVGSEMDIFLPLLGLIGFIFVFSLLLAYVYEVEMMFRSGQTLGKRIMKIRIIPVDPAQTLTRGHAARRFLVQQGAQLVPGLSWVDGLFQLWDKPYRQCLHDKFAKTLVIKLGA
jgi:uncharacterized RDD family membrane protein YckC